MPLLSKHDLRESLLKRRASLPERYPLAKEKIVSLFFDSFSFSPETVMGAYWPRGAEFDTRPLLKSLITAHYTCALPSILPTGTLEFRVWDPSVPLMQGKFNILEPSSSSPRVFPQVLLVPLLGVDRAGNRLGYGQGHYDRYLSHHTPLTIGLGFHEQLVKTIPAQDHDISLDYILTEAELIIPRRVDNPPSDSHT